MTVVVELDAMFLAENDQGAQIMRTPNPLPCANMERSEGQLLEALEFSAFNSRSWQIGHYFSRQSTVDLGVRQRVHSLRAEEVVCLGWPAIARLSRFGQ